MSACLLSNGHVYALINHFAEDLLANTQYKGFAVVSTEEKGILLGYIERTEMQWVIGKVVRACAVDVRAHVSSLDKAANIQPVDANTSCSFGSIARASTPRPSHEIDGDLMPGPGIGVEESISMEILEDGATDGSIHFWPWVNQTPLTVSPHLPLEVVMQLFQRMGYALRCDRSRRSLTNLLQTTGHTRRRSGSAGRTSDGQRRSTLHRAV
jgi:chloride channel 3/4/5